MSSNYVTPRTSALKAGLTQDAYKARGIFDVLIERGVPPKQATNVAAALADLIGPLYLGLAEAGTPEESRSLEWALATKPEAQMLAQQMRDVLARRAGAAQGDPRLFGGLPPQDSPFERASPYYALASAEPVSPVDEWALATRPEEQMFAQQMSGAMARGGSATAPAVDSALLSQLPAGTAYPPAVTSASPGMSLDGTMVQPPSPAPMQQQAPAQQQSPAPDPVASLGQMQAQWQAQNAESEPFFNKLSINQKTGEVNLSMPQGALSEVMAQLTDLKTMKAAAMARVAQLRQHEASGSPLLDALSQMSGHMAANDPTLPGWLRGLGAANLAMGPEGIRQRRAAEEQRAIGLSGDIANLGMKAEALQANNEARAEASIARAAEAVMSRYKIQAQKGIPIDPNALTQELVASNVPADRAATLAFSIAAQSDTARQIATEQMSDKVKDAVFRLDTSERQEITATGVFDEQSFRTKAESLKIPKEQIDALSENFNNFSKTLLEARRRERREKLADEAATRGAANAVWEERFKKTNEALEDRINKRKDIQENERAKTANERFGRFVATQSKPPVDARQAMEGSVQYLQFAKSAEDALAKYGNDVGWQRIAGPTGELFKIFRKSTGEELANLEIMDVMEKVKGSGLAPFSDLDKEMLASVSFSRWKTMEANLKALQMGKEKAIRRLNMLADLNPQWDWDAMMPGMPPEIKSKADTLKQRRIAYFTPYATNPDVDPLLPFMDRAAPAATSAPAAKPPEQKEKTVNENVQAVGGGPGYTVENRTTGKPALPKKKGESVTVGGVTIVRN